MRNSLTAAGFALLLTCAAPVHASNLVANGDFSADVGSGNAPWSPPTDWTVTGSGVGADLTLPNSTNYPADTTDAFLGNGTLSQSVPTTIGASYTVTFWFNADSAAVLNSIFDTSVGFDACFGATVGTPSDCTSGTDLVAGPVAPSYLNTSVGGSPIYTEVTETLAATSSSTLLSFTGYGGQGDAGLGNWYLADVSVVPVRKVETAPEPSSLMMLASLMGLLTFARTRRA